VNNADLNRRRAVQLVESLTTLGLRHAVLSPGARNTPLMLALHDAALAGAPITLHSVIDERAAGFYALGIARQTDQPVLLSCTSGSAAANYFPAIVEASEGMVPLLVATADRPAELQDCGAPQAMNQVHLYGEHVRMALNIEAPEADESDGEFVADIQRAWTAAVGRAPGPVQINLRFRKPLWRADSPVFSTPPIVRTEAQPSTLSETDLQRFVEEVDGHRGVIVVGPDPSVRLREADLQALSDWLGWPILADPVSQLRLGSAVTAVHHHDAMLRSQRFRDAHPYTMAVCVGGTTSSRPLEELLRQTPSIALNPSGRHWNPWGSVTWTMHASPSTLVSHLGKHPAMTGHPDWRQSWMNCDAVAAEAIKTFCAEGLWEGSIAHHLVNALPKNTLLRVASSMPIRDVDSFCVDPGRAIRVSSNRGVNGIDGTVATTLGAAAVHSEPVALLTGDLSMLHDVGALLTTPQPQQPVVITVVDNGGGGIFGFLPMREHTTGFEPWYVTPHHHDIAAIARAMSAQTFSPDTLAECQAAWEEALKTPGVSLVHIKVDRQQSTDTHFAAWAAITSALEATR
jgi:2-succinyl-5-enolpyruvyl-6-hydroxy-3-cyclohexene-1-carboxylate synthase